MSSSGLLHPQSPGGTSLSPRLKQNNSPFHNEVYGPAISNIKINNSGIVELSPEDELGANNSGLNMQPSEAEFKAKQIIQNLKREARSFSHSAEA